MSNLSLGLFSKSWASQKTDLRSCSYEYLSETFSPKALFGTKHFGTLNLDELNQICDDRGRGEMDEMWGELPPMSSVTHVKELQKRYGLETMILAETFKMISNWYRLLHWELGYFGNLKNIFPIQSHKSAMRLWDTARQLNILKGAGASQASAVQFLLLFPPAGDHEFNILPQEYSIEMFDDEYKCFWSTKSDFKASMAYHFTIGPVHKVVLEQGSTYIRNLVLSDYSGAIDWIALKD